MYICVILVLLNTCAYYVVLCVYQWMDENFAAYDPPAEDAPMADPNADDVHMPDSMADPIADAVPTWADPVYPNNGARPPDIILGELMLMYFEWMGTHKVTDACAKAVYTLLHTLLPEDSNSGTWGTARKMLDAIYKQTVQTIEICPNDCIAYYDCKHPTMQHYKHAHRTHCPTCGSDRHLVDADGNRRAAKTGYYLPCGTYTF
jgi:hypothetical protein